jgi:hypothetical protein
MNKSPCSIAFLQNNIAKQNGLLAPIQDVPDQNFGRDACYHDWRFPLFF